VIIYCQNGCSEEGMYGTNSETKNVPMLVLSTIHIKVASQTPSIDATERFVDCCFVPGIENGTINTKMVEKSPYF